METKAYQVSCQSNTIKFRCDGEEKELLSCAILDGAEFGPNICININCTACEAHSGNLAWFSLHGLHKQYMVSVIDLLPYGDIYDSLVPNVDDGSTDVITLNQSFTFFGVTQKRIFVSIVWIL